MRRLYIRLQGDTLEVAVTPLDNFSLEQWTFEDKADFFEHVNGVRPVPYQLRRQLWNF